MLELSSENEKRLLEFASQYKKFAKIYFAVQTRSFNSITVKVWQNETVAGKYLDAKELIQRANDMLLEFIPSNFMLHVRPVVFNEMDHIDHEWIQKKMNDFGLQAKDLVKLMNIDKSTLSNVLGGNKKLTKWHQSTFFFFFKCQELTK